MHVEINHRKVMQNKKHQKNLALLKWVNHLINSQLGSEWGCIVLMRSHKIWTKILSNKKKSLTIIIRWKTQCMKTLEVHKRSNFLKEVKHAYQVIFREKIASQLKLYHSLNHSLHKDKNSLEHRWSKTIHFHNQSIALILWFQLQQLQQLDWLITRA